MAAPPLARVYRKAPKDLNGAPFILPAWSSSIHTQVLDLLADWEVTPRVVVEASDAELARRLAISGVGIAPINAYTISCSAPRGSLTIMKTHKPIGLYESIYLLSQLRRWPHPVIEHLKKNFRLPASASTMRLR
ncbi:MAG: hypothetical protein AUJ52_07585 [Elusimicrobia bacterium CG1_02_63_36]|nr:MAG: hypothetical protein AUJ52_07585 [Elusimicrobia bacterium CG1_02_63_36]